MALDIWLPGAGGTRQHLYWGNRAPVEAVIAGVAPTDPTQNNPSYTYTYVGGNMTQINMGLGGATYRKTFGYDGDGNLTSASGWVQI